MINQSFLKQMNDGQSNNDYLPMHVSALFLLLQNQSPAGLCCQCWQTHFHRVPVDSSAGGLAEAALAVVQLAVPPHFHLLLQARDKGAPLHGFVRVGVNLI